MVINIDILVIENSIVTDFLLYITSQTLRIRKNFRNLVIPALLGGLYVITLLFKNLMIFTILPFKLFMAFIMIFLLFKTKKFIFNLKALSIYILYSMLLAGLCFFIEVNNNDGLNVSWITYNFSYKKLMLAIIILYLLLNRLVIYIRDRIELHSLIYTVDIVLKDCEKTVKAFLDTGNELREPATNLPVMILEKHYMDSNIQEKEILYIPYKVVNGQVDRLIGFKPKYIRIHKGDAFEIRQVIIAFCENKLSNTSEYSALLSRGII